MACVDEQLFHGYIGAALPVFMRNQDCGIGIAAVLGFRGMALRSRDFRFEA